MSAPALVILIPLLATQIRGLEREAQTMTLSSTIQGNLLPDLEKRMTTQENGDSSYKTNIQLSTGAPNPSPRSTSDSHKSSRSKYLSAEASTSPTTTPRSQKSIYNITKSDYLSMEALTTPTTTPRVNLGSYAFSKSDYLMENKDLCHQINPDIFIWVHTAPKNFRRRCALRRTWGNYKLNLRLLKRRTVVGFFVGAVKDSNAQRMLDYEQQLYGDIIQGDYIDHYHNLTYKAVQAVRWITENCNRSRIVIKVDDDALADLSQMFRKIEVFHYLKHPSEGMKNKIICKVFTHSRPLRDKKNKWYISPDYYSPDTFPPYCQGLAVVISADLIPKMYEAALKLPLLWIDDTSIFGIIVKDINATLLSFSYPGPYHDPLRSVIEKVSLGTEPAYHMAKINDFHYVWSAILHRELQHIQKTKHS